MTRCGNGAILALWLTAAAVLAQAPAPPFTLKAVGAGVYAAIDGPEGRSGANAGFVIGDDGVLVVDSFYTPDAARALLAEIARLTAKPVRYVVNTHYHIDHTGGDAVFRQAGAVIVAHRNVRSWVHDENIHLFGSRLTDERRQQIEQLALPDLVTEHPLTIWLGGRRIEIRPVEGHTGGDLLIAVPDAKVLFCGDMLWRQVSPNLIDGTVVKWLAALEAFRRLPDADAITFVPGHGDIAAVADVAAFADYLQTLSALTAEQRQAGKAGDALVEAVLPALRSRFGDWSGFTVMAPREIHFMEDELAGRKRVPQPVAEAGR